MTLARQVATTVDVPDPRAAAVLAVDVGNRKTDCALVAADGTVIGAVRGPTASHQAVGLERGLDRLVELAMRVAVAAHVVPATPAGRRPARLPRRTRRPGRRVLPRRRRHAPRHPPSREGARPTRPGCRGAHQERHRRRAARRRRPTGGGSCSSAARGSTAWVSTLTGGPSASRRSARSRVTGVAATGSERRRWRPRCAGATAGARGPPSSWPSRRTSGWVDRST